MTNAMVLPWHEPAAEALADSEAEAEAEVDEAVFEPELEQAASSKDAAPAVMARPRGALLFSRNM
jgi:hypothetical protein